MRRCTGLRSRLSYFSITGVELLAESGLLRDRTCGALNYICNFLGMRDVD